MAGNAFVTLCTSDRYVPGAVTVAASLRRVQASCTIVCVVAGLGGEARCVSGHYAINVGARVCARARAGARAAVPRGFQPGASPAAPAAPPRPPRCCESPPRHHHHIPIEHTHTNCTCGISQNLAVPPAAGRPAPGTTPGRPAIFRGAASCWRPLLAARGSAVLACWLVSRQRPQSAG